VPGGWLRRTGDFPLNTNLCDIFLCVKYEIRPMLEDGASGIVNYSSIATTMAPEVHSKLTAMHPIDRCGRAPRDRRGSRLAARRGR
jgi:NAD(P)-dependent dehydrogenase (short-subunit alcohol dehydrogenase family)